MSRRAAIVVVLASALAMAGCGPTTRTTVSQPGVIGQVRIDVSVCAFGHSQDGTSCDGLSDDGTYQGLIALRLPASATLPDALTLRSTAGGADQVFTRSASYEEQLNTLVPADAGFTWHGYLGPPGPYESDGERSLAFALDVPLPAAPAGEPFAGPYRERVFAGFRQVTEEQPADREVTCGDPPNSAAADGTVCINEENVAAHRTHPTRDLVVAAGSATSAVRAAATSVAFELRFRGPAGAAFPLSAATALAGATATPRETTFAPGEDEVRTVAVDLTVPRGTPDGDYPVTLTAGPAGGEQRSATAIVRVAEGLQEPRKLTLRAKPARDRRKPYRFRLSGALTGPDGMPAAQACTGKVALTITAGNRTAFSREVDLAPDCTYRARGRSSRKGRLRAGARFLGNAALSALSAPTTRLRAG